MTEHRLSERDRPWVMRTYAGHSDARRSNELYRRNLAKGQTGLSIAFDLPTQTGYDPDHELSRSEVGKVGVLIADTIAFTVDEVPKWNPINICSYHLQEAGATPAQEAAYALSTAIAVLDSVRDRVDEETFPRVFGRISFFVNAGIRFIEEHAKLRAMGEIWEQMGRERYGVTDPKLLRFR